MTFDEILTQVLGLLRRDGRVSYWALRRRVDLDAEYLEDLNAGIIQAKQLAVDEDDAMLECKLTDLFVHVYNTAIRSTSIRAPGRSNAFTPIGVTAGRWSPNRVRRCTLTASYCSSPTT
jgi:hypothetical protein